MKIRHRTAATTFGAVALLVGSAIAGQADTIYNTLDGSIDAEHEVMNLTWNSTTLVGSTGSTILRMRIDGNAEGDRGGCNVQGGPQFVTVTAHSTDPSVVVLTNGPSYTFDKCSDAPAVAVRATGIGSASIELVVTAFQSSSDASGPVWPTTPADFDVSVVEGGGTTSTGCDVDPAAPAWAAAILQRSGFKAGAKQTTNLVSQIAGEMLAHADFPSVPVAIQKSAHPYYENAVHDRLEAITGKTLVSASLAARPGWTCLPTS